VGPTFEQAQQALLIGASQRHIGGLHWRHFQLGGYPQSIGQLADKVNDLDGRVVSNIDHSGMLNPGVQLAQAHDGSDCVVHKGEVAQQLALGEQTHRLPTA